MVAALGSLDRPHRVAVVGAGPAGFYVADALLRTPDYHVQVDILERWPAPFGLVRYGVAPDHPRIRSVTTSFESILASPQLRFLGNVELGSTVSLEELHALYDDVVLTLGLSEPRNLRIPGEDLVGSVAASEFVGWYNVEPPFVDRSFNLHEAERALVVGHGNVALDVARILVRDPDELASTEIGEHALQALRNNRIRDVELLGRRGPAQASFTPVEIRELASLQGVSLVWPTKDRELDAASEAWLASSPNREAERMVTILRMLPDEPAPGNRSVWLRFFQSPREWHAGDRGQVVGATLERTRLVANPDGGPPWPEWTGETWRQDAQLAVRAIGRQGSPLAGVPFDARSGLVPNQAGRVVNTEHPERPPLYVAGWVKRGSTGRIGLNRACAQETVATLLQDRAGTTAAAGPDWPERSQAFFASRVPELFDKARWLALDTLERRAGQDRGKPREKFTSVGAMVEATREEG